MRTKQSEEMLFTNIKRPLWYKGIYVVTINNHPRQSRLQTAHFLISILNIAFLKIYLEQILEWWQTLPFSPNTCQWPLMFFFSFSPTSLSLLLARFGRFFLLANNHWFYRLLWLQGFFKCFHFSAIDIKILIATLLLQSYFCPGRMCETCWSWNYHFSFMTSCDKKSGNKACNLQYQGSKWTVAKLAEKRGHGSGCTCGR